MQPRPCNPRAESSVALVSGPAEASDGLHPAEDLLDTLADPLADGVADVSRDARVDGRPSTPCRVAGYVRGHVHRTAVIHELEGVVALVTADGNRPRTDEFFLDHFQSGGPFRLAVGF